ncbi:hypothetical protein COX64_02110 [Candidatus Dojkabacteria bacterium CG_4_10_14_0_2_um_filter_Dojkabacteria_WS6_41_15]|uniref:Glycosyl transferase family 1 domain-containing protein n=1 Tax=Candidatus Dojkabacteria bacterium CG_4_10_14_0_2_um_filter_Dojkabacteria_WS6_41_15 TaxID=2014249 RepID=A0A2M7W271_9BACT|nr:MAG: hypothetical protein COX64_02110 [Candidatus Dojkabacteria bacterium CG_4_10_14_0_2_um_filter_Dojkabacteria_WS6_41_15]
METMKTTNGETESIRVKVQIPIPDRVHKKFTATLLKLGYRAPDELFVEVKVHPLTQKVLNTYDCLPLIDISNKGQELTGIETVRKFQLKDGYSAYNYLVAQQVEVDTSMPSHKVALYICGALKEEMPQGFANTCAEAGRKVDAHLQKEYKHNTYKSDITELERRTIVLNTLVNKCTVFLKRRGIEDEQFLIDLVPRFIQARSIMSKIKTGDGTAAYMSGAIDDLLLEGCLGATVNLLFIKCPRVVQYYDKLGEKRLDILTSVHEEVRESVDGDRTYPGSEYFSKYLHDFQEQFSKVGIQMVPVVLVDDMTRIDEYSPEDNAEIPRKALSYGLKYKPTTLYFMIGLAPDSRSKSILLTYPYVLLGLFGKPLGTRTVIRLVKSGDYERLIRYVPAIILRCFDYVCLSRSEKRNVRRTNKVSRVKYLVNSVDSKLFCPKTMKKKGFTYGYIGSFSKEKNLPLLVRAYAQLPLEIRMNSQLVLIGANPPDCCNDCKMAVTELNQEIAKHNLGNEITVKPYVPLSTPEIAANEYRSFAVTIWASAQEGCPNMVLESLSCGVPVLFYAGAKEIAEVANEKVSIRFKKLYASSITTALRRAFTASKKLSINTRAYAVANFCLSKTIENAINFIS